MIAAAPSRVVVRSPNWLGDAIMSLPALGAIRRRYPDAHLAVACPASLAPLYKDVEAVSEVIALEGGSRVVRWWSWMENARRLERRRLDVAILFPNSFHSALVAHAARIPERWGYRTDLRGVLLTRAVDRPRRHDRTHHVEHYNQLVASLGIPVRADKASLTASAAERARARELLARLTTTPGPLVGIAPGAAYGFAKRWPPDRVADLVLLIDRELGGTSLLLGSAGDRATSRAVQSAVARFAKGSAPPPRLLDLVDRTDLGLLIGLISCCDAFVSNDSGAMHLASALGVPVTAVFGPTDEHGTAPLGPHDIVTNPVWCRPCLLRECPLDHQCLTGISAARVFERVRDHLQRRSSRVAG
ncbi:MAG: lipopolysaccharide heptosyltransferase II [Acidobacteria bacterium]|nr:lipopolysaccharide heptosyltransferase II [Acidobacteriota bacterium]